MGRLQLFEFNEQPWLPQFMTGWMTSILRICHRETEDGRVWAPKILELMERSGTTAIVDLCSGGGGPVLDLVRILEQEYGIVPNLTLTDLIPNLQAAREINGSRDGWRYVTESIDATRVPNELCGIRTVFSGFHHLRPELAFGLLKSAFISRQPIFIGETTQRSLRAIRVYGKVPIYFFGMTQRIAATPAQRLFTFGVPVLPMMLGWDNVVSCLRTYSPQEIRDLLTGLRADDYRWELGELDNPKIATPYSYIMGYPLRGA